jgi:hypothetical protein
MSHQTVFRQKVSPWLSLFALGLGVSMSFFDQQTGKVSIECRSLLGTTRKGVHSLSSYNRVVSYLTITRHTPNWIALVSLDERTYLHLLHFSPAWTSTSFWSSPSSTESPSARSVREKLRDDLGLIDLGFLGTYVPENYKHRMV